MALAPDVQPVDTTKALAGNGNERSTTRPTSSNRESSLLWSEPSQP
jgi:hypothetical protein